MIEALILVFSLAGEPAVLNQTSDFDLVPERKRTHKKRRKIRKPKKGLR